MPVDLHLVTAPTPEACALIDELEQEVSGYYPPDQLHGYTVDQVFQPHVRFFVARLDGHAVGCGGIVLEGRIAECIRVYVRPTHRGQQIGAALLARLEAEAIAQGAKLLRLETGDVLDAALRLYQSGGFQTCEPFGAYLEMPAEAIRRSILWRSPL